MDRIYVSGQGAVATSSERGINSHIPRTEGSFWMAWVCDHILASQEGFCSWS
jgi:hypothetical protein